MMVQLPMTVADAGVTERIEPSNSRDIAPTNMRT